MRYRQRKDVRLFGNARFFAGIPSSAEMLGAIRATLSPSTFGAGRRPSPIIRRSFLKASRCSGSLTGMVSRGRTSLCSAPFGNGDDFGFACSLCGLSHPATARINTAVARDFQGIHSGFFMLFHLRLHGNVSLVRKIRFVIYWLAHTMRAIHSISLRAMILSSCSGLTDTSSTSVAVLRASSLAITSPSFVLTTTRSFFRIFAPG